MRLARLTGLEMEKLDAELAQVRERIAELERILGDLGVRLGHRQGRAAGGRREVRTTTAARSQIVGGVSSFDVEDLIADEEVVITLSRQGYVKAHPHRRLPLPSDGEDGGCGAWAPRRRTGSTTSSSPPPTTTSWSSATGAGATGSRSGAFPKEAGRPKGKPIVNLVDLNAGESVASVVAVREFPEDRFLLFCTRNGVVKKTPLSAYGNVRAVGIYADQRAGRRRPDRRAAHRRRQRSASGHRQGKGDPLPRVRRPADGAHRRRRARHTPGRGRRGGGHGGGASSPTPRCWWRRSTGWGSGARSATTASSSAAARA